MGGLNHSPVNIVQEVSLIKEICECMKELFMKDIKDLIPKMLRMVSKMLFKNPNNIKKNQKKFNSKKLSSEKINLEKFNSERFNSKKFNSKTDIIHLKLE